MIPAYQRKVPEVQPPTNPGHLIWLERHHPGQRVIYQLTVSEEFDGTHGKSACWTIIFKAFDLITPVFIRFSVTHQIEAKLKRSRYEH